MAQTLVDSEIRYRRLFEAAQDGILILDAETGEIEDANPFLLHLLGYSHDELLQKKLWQVGAFKDIATSQDAFVALQANEFIRYDDQPLKTKDGRLVQVEFVSNVYRVGDQKVIQCNIRDISERKQAEKYALASHERYRATLNNMMEGCQIIDYDWRYIYVNDAAAMHGHKTPVELLMHTMMDVYPGIENTDLFRKLQFSMNKRVRQRIENQFFYGDGTSGWFELSIQPVPEGIFILSIDITERKQVDDVRAKLAAIVESSDDAIFGIFEGAIISWNLGAERLYGYLAQEIIGKPVSFLMPPNRFDELSKIANRIASGESIKNFETVRLRKDGTFVDISLTVSPIKDASGQVRGGSAISRDITERKQAEALLRTNQQRLTLALNATRTGVWEWNAQLSEIYWSPECYEIFELDALTEKTLEGFFKLIHPDDFDRYLACVQQAVNQKESFDVEFRVKNQRDELLWLQEIGRAEYDADGNPVRMIGTISNITTRKKSEELIRESDNRFRALLENSTDAITLLDINGVVIYDSPAAPGMLGYTSDDWIGQNVFALVHPDDAPQVRALFENLAQRIGDRFQRTFRVRHKNSFWVWIEVVATNLLHQPGVNAIVLNYRDITRRKQADERLRSTREFLQSVQDAMASHIAILDDKGTVVQVNAAWRAFGAQNGLVSVNDCIGMNYLDVCDNAQGQYADEAALVAGKIREVLVGLKQEVWLEYPCHAPDQDRWFIVHINSFENNASKWLIVSHINITERKQVETEVRQRLSELEVLYQSGLVFSHLLNPKMIAKKMIELLDQKMDWHHSAIRLYHPESETLELLAFHLPHSTSSQERTAAKKRFKRIQRPDQGLSGWVLRHGRVVRCNDFKKDARYFETFPGLQSGMYVPIKIADRVLGVISIESEELDAFQKSDERLVVTLAAQVAVAIENAQLFERLKHSNLDLVSAYDATIEGWSRALDLRDKETEGHSLRVTEMTLTLSRALGLSEDDLAQIRWGALLHDIGKMGIPDGILLKPGPLTAEEWVIMKKHPTFAYEMLSPIHYLRHALDIPHYHHEKWDGSGYPHGLKGTEIPLAARIFAVVDVWDALKSNRTYRAGWPDEKVREHIRFSAGTHFDPNIVDMFMKTFG